jgi:hypothetical protein
MRPSISSQARRFGDRGYSHNACAVGRGAQHTPKRRERGASYDCDGLAGSGSRPSLPLGQRLPPKAPIRPRKPLRSLSSSNLVFFYTPLRSTTNAERNRSELGCSPGRGTRPLASHDLHPHCIAAPCALTWGTMSYRSPMLRARRRCWSPSGWSRARRDSRTVGNSSRPSAVVPLRLSAPITSHPAAPSAVTASRALLQ